MVTLNYEYQQLLFASSYLLETEQDKLKVRTALNSSVLGTIAIVLGLITFISGFFGSLALTACGLMIVLGPIAYSFWKHPSFIEIDNKRSVVTIKRNYLPTSIIPFDKIDHVSVEKYFHSTFVDPFHNSNKEAVYELHITLNNGKRLKFLRIFPEKEIDSTMQKMAYNFNTILGKV